MKKASTELPSRIQLRLDGRDIFDLFNGKVLFKDELGQPLGVGDGHTMGDNPVEIALTKSDAEQFRLLMKRAVGTSGGYQVEGDWPACPHCKLTAGYDSDVLPGTSPEVRVVCRGCLKTVSQQPLSIP